MTVRPADVLLSSVGTAVPPLRLSQADALQFALDHFEIKNSTKSLYRRVFADDSVAVRSFALSELTEIMEKDHDRINRRFEKWAVDLSEASFKAALRQTVWTAEQVDFLVTTTCTGYLCPGLGAYLVDRVGLRRNVRYVDLVGMGCGAALPALSLAADFLRSHPGSVAAVVCTEISSAAMFSNDSPDIVISNALFSDGSAAAVLTSTETPSPSAAWRLKRFASLNVPEWRDTLRFRTENGYLRNVLSKDVPRQSAAIMRSLVPPLLSEEGLTPEGVSHWLLHAGGKKILDSIGNDLALPPEKLTSSRHVLRQYGNMSSPTVLFVTAEENLSRPPRPGDWGIIASFGAGFSAHAALLQYS